MDNILHFPVTLEFLELMASAFAPPSGAVLWRNDKDLRLVRSEGEALTADFCCGLVTEPRKESVVNLLPKRVEAVYGPGFLDHLPHLTPGKCAEAVVKSMRRDAIDYSPPRKQGKHNHPKHK